MRQEIVLIRVVATLLVVLGHSEFYEGFSGFYSYMIPGIDGDTIWNRVCRFIYTFHMPLFFTISGLLMALSIKKCGLGQFDGVAFIKKKAFRLLLPFAVITIFYCLPIKILTGYYSLDQISTAMYEQLVFAKGAHTWFMLALFWCMLAGTVLVITLRKRITLYISIVVILCVHLIGAPNFTHGLFTIFCYDKATAFYLFFFFGFLIGYSKRERKLFEEIPPPIILTIFCLGEAFLFSSYYPKLASGGFIGSRASLLVRDIVGIAAFLVSIILSKKFLKTMRIDKSLQYIDKYSFEIYLYSEPLNYLALYGCTLCGGWYYGDGSLFIIRFIMTLTLSLLLAKVITINYGQKSTRKKTRLV